MSIFVGSLGLLLLLFVILWLPVTFHGEASLAEKISLNGEIAWAGGLVTVLLAVRSGKATCFIKLGGWTRGLPIAKQRDVHPEKKSQKTSVSSRVNTIKPYLNKELMAKGINFISRLFQCLNLSLRLEGEYGTGDPALTGYLVGLFATGRNGRHTINLCPNFTEPILDLHGEIKGKVVPAIIIGLTIRFLLSSPVRPLWLKRKSKLKYKEVIQND